MHLNSAALSNYLFWNVSLCKSTKGVGFREKIATATAMGLYAAGVQDRARGLDSLSLLPQEILLPGLGDELPGGSKDCSQMSRSFSG